MFYTLCLSFSLLHNLPLFTTSLLFRSFLLQGYCMVSPPVRLETPFLYCSSPLWGPRPTSRGPYKFLSFSPLILSYLTRSPCSSLQSFRSSTPDLTSSVHPVTSMKPKMKLTLPPVTSQKSSSPCTILNVKLS